MCEMKNILFLSTYTTVNALHGGQVRSSALIKYYQNLGYKVHASGVLGSLKFASDEDAIYYADYPDADDFSNIIDNSFLMEDYCISQLFEHGKYFNLLCEKLHHDYDLIHVEQPWLMNFAIHYKEKYCKNAKVIYGSANVEHELKGSILSHYFDDRHVKFCTEAILKLEIEVIRKSDYCLAVSEYDADFIREYRDDCIIVPNGASALTLDPVNSLQVKNLPNSYAIFCASGHPPNVYGFIEMLKNLDCFARRGHKLLIVGSVCESIRNSVEFKSSLYDDNILYMNEVERSVLNWLLLNSRVIILPITQGGGTNLKTAEAIISGKAIVATSVAMRGFEKFTADKSIKVENEPIRFVNALCEAMENELMDPDNQLNRTSIAWDHCLSGLDKFKDF